MIVHFLTTLRSGAILERICHIRDLLKPKEDWVPLNQPLRTFLISEEPITYMCLVFLIDSHLYKSCNRTWGPRVVFLFCRSSLRNIWAWFFLSLCEYVADFPLALERFLHFRRVMILHLCQFQRGEVALTGVIEVLDMASQEPGSVKVLQSSFDLTTG